MGLTRRRFLSISAALPVVAGLPAGAGAERIIRGQAMGATIRLHLRHPEAERLGALAMSEIARQEQIFSLYRAESVLSRLNARGQLADPPPDLLNVLSLAAAVHRASAGRFDPTIQPLWALLARFHADGLAPDPDQVAQARALVGWDRLDYDNRTIRLRPGMALTFNGIAQGYVADRVASLLRAEGLEIGLIDTGELRAMGPEWPVRVEGGPTLHLKDRALATSGPFGTVMDRDGRQGHILSPGADAPRPKWERVTISAPLAAVADALSTAACLIPDADAVQRMIAGFDGARVEHLAEFA